MSRTDAGSLMGVIGKRKRQAARTQGDSAGFAAVDALVALTLLSTTLVLSLQAIATIQKSTAAALEARRAEALLDYLMVSHRSRTGEWSGVSQGLGWRLGVRPEGSAPDNAICRRDAAARSEKSHRRYELSTLEPCPVEGLG